MSRDREDMESSETGGEEKSWREGDSVRDDEEGRKVRKRP